MAEIHAYILATIAGNDEDRRAALPEAQRAECLDLDHLDAVIRKAVPHD